MEGRGYDDSLIVRSPFADLEKENIVIPNVSYPEFIFGCIRRNTNILGDRAAVVDAVRNQSLLYKDIEPLAIRFASALTKRGFKKGDVFFFVTSNSALLFALHFGVQLCGGAPRGYNPLAEQDELEQQMRDSSARFILLDPGTAEKVKIAAGRLAWPVSYFCIDGAVEGASPVEEMAREDDGTAYKKDVPINLKEDALAIFATGGSTGQAKGVLHTHRTMTTFMARLGAPFDFEREHLEGETTLAVLGNFGIGSYVMMHNTLVHGGTFVFISTFEKNSFFKFFDQYKPENLVLFAYIANQISRLPETFTRDVSFVKNIMLTGSVVNAATTESLLKAFPHAKLDTAYGLTETLTISSYHFFLPYKIRRDRDKEALRQMKVMKIEDDSYVSNGKLIPLVEAKIVDVESGDIVGRGVKGRVMVRSPSIMRGYVESSAKQGYRSTHYENGWFDTGDLGFFDGDGHLYIAERLNMIFKHFMLMVSPAEIEGVILQLPTIQSVCVVGVPHPTTTSAATAYVVVKKGCSVTEEEIEKHVAGHLPFYKHLHGGVIFKDELPLSLGGKVDRLALLNEAIRENKYDLGD